MKSIEHDFHSKLLMPAGDRWLPFFAETTAAASAAPIDSVALPSEETFNQMSDIQFTSVRV